MSPQKYDPSETPQECPYRDMGTLIKDRSVLVASGLDLRSLSEVFIKDDIGTLKRLMGEGLLLSPSEALLKELEERNPRIRFVEVPPYVLLQTIDP